MNDTSLVITGMSSISALGTGTEACAAGLTGTPVTIPVQAFEFHELDQPLPCFRTAGFDAEAILGKKGLRTKDLSTKLLLATMDLGFKSLFESMSPGLRPGIVVGTAFGSVESIGNFLSDSIVNGVNAVNPMLFANTVINSPTGNANIRYEVKPLSATVSTGFNAGLDALIYACDYIRSGNHSALVAGGLEEISYYILLGMSLSGALSRSGTIKPYAPDADGTVMGEGCAMFSIETREHALARGTGIIAEIAGYAAAFDPGDGTAGFNPQGDGAKSAIRETLRMAGIDAKQVGFIAGSGNGVAAGDAMESLVIRELFGDIPVAAYKAKTGECYGASSAISVACALADMRAQRISGTGMPCTPLNGINLVTDSIGNTRSEYVLVTSFSCEGYYSSMLLKNYDY